MLHRLAACAAALLLLAGCAHQSSYTAASPSDTRRLIIDKPVTVDWGIAELIAPAGTYTPEGSDEQGTYFKAPTHLISGHHLFPGGIFIPNNPGAEPEVYYDGRSVGTFNPRQRTSLSQPLHYTLQP